jgi:hypothetical protein
MASLPLPLRLAVLTTLLHFLAVGGVLAQDRILTLHVTEVGDGALNGIALKVVGAGSTERTADGGIAKIQLASSVKSSLQRCEARET